jgi:dihydrolipoamide dehydrogenase
MATTEVKVPDIGDFEGVEVIEVHVRPGDRLAAEDPMITLESDKASMEVPAPAAGEVKEVKLRTGDRVSEGDLILLLETEAAEAAKPAAASAGKPEPTKPAEPKAAKPEPTKDEARKPAAAPAPSTAGQGDIEAELVVLGSGPGGYTAAFRAADLGLRTVLVERYPTLGGVCLNVGCIPSKALLHAAKVIAEAREMSEHGLRFEKPEIDLDKLADWKDAVVGRLTGGLTGLAKQRKVQVVQGVGTFISRNQLEVATDSGKKTIGFAQAIIAAGSAPVFLPFIPRDDPRVIDSTGALELEGVPERLLVLGGGIIGLEMATVYHELGSRITIVELLDQLIPGADPDIIRPLHKRIEGLYENVFLGTKATAIKPNRQGLEVSFEGPKAPKSDVFDKILVAVGRRPNGKGIGADAAGVAVDDRGFIPVDKQQRTNVPHIFAIGDVVGQPMLAHKATHEAKVAAEAAAGRNSFFDVKCIPSVAYTDPEVAWAGLTETEAKAKGIKYGKGSFPWAASGRALGLARPEGLTKLLFEEESGRLLGAGIVGVNAGDLIAEIALAIEMGADAEDVGLTVHPHPTLSETIAFSAEAFAGTLTDLYLPKRR